MRTLVITLLVALTSAVFSQSKVYLPGATDSTISKSVLQFADHLETTGDFAVSEFKLSKVYRAEGKIVEATCSESVFNAQTKRLIAQFEDGDKLYIESIKITDNPNNERIEPIILTVVE